MHQTVYAILFALLTGSVPYFGGISEYSDTLYVSIIEEQSSPSMFPGMPSLSYVKKLAIVQYVYPDSIDASERLLDSPVVISVDTVCILSRCTQREALLETQFSTGSQGHAHFDRTDSLSLLVESSGFLDRSYAAVTNHTQFYEVSSVFTPDDFPAAMLTADLGSRDSSSIATSILRTVSLFESMDVSSRWWTSLNLPGESQIWGSRSPSIRSKNAVVARSATLAFEPNATVSSAAFCPSPLDDAIPGLISEVLLDPSSDPDILLSYLADTLFLSQEGYVFLSDEVESDIPAMQEGWVYYVPYAGPLLDSLVIGQYPSLREITTAAIEIAAAKGISLATNYAFLKIIAPLNSRLLEYADRIISPRSAAFQISAAEHRALLRSNLMVDDLMSSNQQAHHIIALSDSRFNVARTHMNRLGLGIDDVVNGVGLSTEAHARMHTNRYAYEVTSRFLNAATREQGIQVLHQISQEMLSNRFPY